MKSLCWLCWILIPSLSLAQQTVALSKHSIGNSGCHVSLPKPPGEVEISLDVDSNKVYTTLVETMVNEQELHYYVNIVQLREGAVTEDIFERLTQYLDYIKSTQNIVSSTGYKKVNNLVKGKLSKSLSDSWTDHSGQEYTVMGWAQGRTMAVLYVSGQGSIPAQAGASNFLNSFQFPSAF